MSSAIKVGGSILWSYNACKRQAWLMSRQITGEQENNFLMIGRMIHENTYKHRKKEILFDNCKFDMIERRGSKQVVAEIKKSSKSIDSAIMQLKYYLYRLHKRGHNLEGEIKIPLEKKVIRVKLEESDIEEIKQKIDEIETLINSDTIPAAKHHKYCRTCSYNDFCWS